MFLRDLQGRVDGEAARAADQESLLGREPASGEEAVAVGDGHVAVDDARVEGLRPEVLADPLDEVGMHLVVGVDAADRVGPDHLEVRVLLAQISRDAGDRAAGADAAHEVGDPAARLAPQLGPRGQVVRLRVGGVRVLVRLERSGDLLGQPVRDAVVGLRRVWAHVRGSDDDLGAVGAQQVDLLLRHLVRHHGDHAVALQAGGDREPGAGVAGGRLDDRAARTQPAVPLGGLHQPHRDAVLDRAPGIELLELGDELRSHAGADPAQPHQRRLADRVEDRVLDVRSAACRGRAHALTIGNWPRSSGRPREVR